MAQPNISLLGATYNGVTGVTLPKQGGGTATFPWVEGSETKTSNGTYDVTNLAELVVNVSGGGGTGLVYETGTYTPTSDIDSEIIYFTNSHTNNPFFVLLQDITTGSTASASSNLYLAIASWYDLTGLTYNGFAQYARVQYGYVSSSNSFSISGVNIVGEIGTTTTYLSYWLGNDHFLAYTANDFRKWRSGRTYKWIAVWKPTS